MKYDWDVVSDSDIGELYSLGEQPFKLDYKYRVITGTKIPDDDPLEPKPDDPNTKPPPPTPPIKPVIPPPIPDDDPNADLPSGYAEVEPDQWQYSPQIEATNPYIKSMKLRHN